MALTVELTATRGEGASDFPGSRAWFDSLVEDIYSYETPELDGDLVGENPVSAVFKIGYDDEGRYKTTLALICGVSAATPGWCWTVTLDIEGTGESFLGPASVTFTDGECYGNSQQWQSYVGKARRKKWSDLPSPQPPEAARQPDAALWLRLTGPQAKKANAAVKERMFDVMWPQAPPRLEGDRFILPVHSRESAVLLAALALSVTHDHNAQAVVGSSEGVFDDYGLDGPIEGGALNGDCDALRFEVSQAASELPGIHANPSVTLPPFAFMARIDGLDEGTYQQRRAWFTDGILVAFAEPDGIALEYTGPSVDATRDERLAEGRMAIFPDTPGSAPNVRKAIERARQRQQLLQRTDTTTGRTKAVNNACLTLLTGTPPTVDVELANALRRWRPEPLLEHLRNRMYALVTDTVSQAVVAEDTARAQARSAKRSLYAVMRSVNAGKEKVSSLDRFSDSDIVSKALSRPAIASKKASDAVEQRLSRVALVDYTQAALEGWRTLKKKSSVPEWMSEYRQLPELHTQWAIDLCSRTDRQYHAFLLLRDVHNDQTSAVLLEWVRRNGNFLKPEYLDTIASRVPSAEALLLELKKKGRLTSTADEQLKAMTASHRAFLDACARCDTPAEVTERVNNPPVHIQDYIRDAKARLRARLEAEAAAEAGDARD